MTSSDREQLLVYLVEAELYENRVTNAIKRITHRVDPNAVLGQDPVLVPRWRGAGQAIGNAAREAEAFVLGAPGVRRTTRSGAGGLGRGVPGFMGTQAYGHAVTAKRKLAAAAAPVGKFISAGARGEGIRASLQPRTVVIPANLDGTGGSISHGRNYAGFAKSLGRTGAVYGGAAALAAGGALGARAAYRRYKRRKAEREE